MSKFRFSLEGGDVTAMAPATWESLNNSISAALAECGADGLRVSGFQMPDNEVERIFGNDTPGLPERVLVSDAVAGP